MLGHALQLMNGFYDPAALAWLPASLALALAGVVTWQSPGADREASAFRLVAGAGVAWQVAQLLTAPPGIYLAPRANLQVFRAGVIVAAAAIAWGVSGIRFGRKL